jgi:hypothetical protein
LHLCEFVSVSRLILGFFWHFKKITKNLAKEIKTDEEPILL